MPFNPFSDIQLNPTPEPNPAYANEAIQAIAGPAPPEGEWADWYARNQAAAQQSVRDFLRGSYLAPGQTPSVPAIRMALGIANNLRQTVNPAEISALDEAVKRYLPSPGAEMTPELRNTVMDYLGGKWGDYAYNPGAGKWVPSVQGFGQGAETATKAAEKSPFSINPVGAPQDNPKLNLNWPGENPPGGTPSLTPPAGGGQRPTAAPSIDYQTYLDRLSPDNPNKPIIQSILKQGLIPTTKMIDKTNDLEIEVRAAKNSLRGGAKPGEKPPTHAEKKETLLNGFMIAADSFNTPDDYAKELERPRTKHIILASVGQAGLDKLRQYAATLSFTRGPNFEPGMTQNPMERFIEKARAKGLLD